MRASDERGVRVTVPPRTAFVGLLRTMIASVAARSDASIDEVEDLRLAVDEAVALLLGSVPDATRLDLTIDPGADGIACVIGVDPSNIPWPPEDAERGFGWQILSGLTSDARFERGADGEPSIRFACRFRRGGA